MGKYKRNKFIDYKKEAVIAAMDLLYGEEVVKKIQKAKTSDEIADIMTKARKRKDLINR